VLALKLGTAGVAHVSPACTGGGFPLTTWAKCLNIRVFLYAMSNKNSQTQTGPKTELEIIQQYRDEVRGAVLNAVRAVRSCVVFYSDIYFALGETIKDEDTFRQVEDALWTTIDGLKLGDITLYKIYSDPEDSFRDVVVVAFRRKLSEEQLKILREVASLFGTDFYDRYNEGEEQFFDSMPIYETRRTEVYTVLHNLVRMWTGCGADLLDEES
jgi:hypothetical protein